MLALLCWPAGGHAQPQTRAGRWAALRQQKAQTLHAPERGTVEGLLLKLEQSRVLEDREPLNVYNVQPVFGGIQSGAGATAGLRYDPTLGEQDRLLAVEGLVSSKRYWSIKVLGGYAPEPLALYGYARYRHLPEEDFFGIGRYTSKGDHASYRRDAAVVGGLVGAQLTPHLFTGVHLSYQVNRLGRGMDDATPGVRERFVLDDVPGLTEDIDYVLAGGFLAFTTQDHQPGRGFGRGFAPTEGRLDGLALSARRGLYGSVEALRYAGVTAGATLGFTRLDVDVQQYVPIRHGLQGLAFREHLAVTLPDTDADVPFYLMPSLGGSDSVRGLDNFRFRDRAAVLVNAEYRWEVWHFLDLALFADAGQVFRDADELTFAGFETSYGLGLRLKENARRAFARLDLARSDEGVQVIVQFGSFL